MEVGEDTKNSHLWGPLGPYFGTPGVILVAFWRLGPPLGPFWGPVGYWVLKWSLFTPSPGSILGTFWTPKRNRIMKSMKKVVSGSGLETHHVTNRVWRGPKPHPIDKYHMFREVGGDNLGHFGRPLGSLLVPFWTLFRLPTVPKGAFLWVGKLVRKNMKKESRKGTRDMRQTPLWSPKTKTSRPATSSQHPSSQ